MSLAGGIGGTDAAAAHDYALCGKIGSLYMLHQVVQRGVRVIQNADGGVNDLPEIVRRDIGGHANGDAG